MVCKDKNILEKIATSQLPFLLPQAASLQKATGLFANRSRPRNDVSAEYFRFGIYLCCQTKHLELLTNIFSIFSKKENRFSTNIPKFVRIG